MRVEIDKFLPFLCCDVLDSDCGFVAILGVLESYRQM